MTLPTIIGNDPDIRILVDGKPPRTSVYLLYTITALLLIGLVWAAFAELEEVARGAGRVIPSRQIQVVQSPERGIIKEIAAEEGGIVEAGQVLVRIDDTGFSSELGEIEQKRLALLAQVARLDAESTGAELAFDDDLRQKAPDLVAEQESVYRAKHDAYGNDILVLEKQADQRRSEIAELTAKRDQLRTTTEIMRRELAIKEKLYRTKVLPEVQYLELSRHFKENEGELAVTEASIGRAEAALQEAEERLNNATLQFRATAQEELANTRAELSVLGETVRRAEHKVSGTELKSPVKGVVNKLNVTSLGAVVQPGENIVEIVPMEDSLLIEARIRPQDVAFLHPGQKANVKITAYDFSIYGGLSGSLERISADTTTDDNGDTYYRVIIKTDKNYLRTETSPLPIIPGMVATVDILTGKKSVLDYLLKPITKMRKEALRER